MDDSASSSLACRPIECDVAIVGAELAGLIAGAILARQGRSVVVVDTPPQVGGGGGGTSLGGFWLDGGHREGHDVTDMEVAWRHGERAAREAGVEVPIAPIASALRVHLFPEFPPRAPSPSLPGDFSPGGFARLASEAFGVTADQMPDFLAVMARLSGAGSEQREAALETPLGEWLDAADSSPGVRRAILVMVKTIFCEYPERASAGRLMSFFSDGSDREGMRSGIPDDAECGGMQGLSAPFARALEVHGGRILLDQKPLEILFEGRRATGVVALGPAQLVLEVHARSTIVSYPVWDVLPLLPPERVDPGLARVSEQLEDESADGLSLQIGLARLPRLRATGEVENHAGWNRFLVGDERRYQGGFHIPSMSSQRAAPPGQHLLNAMALRWLRREERPRWSETKRTLDAMRATLREIYLDFDDCVRWEAYQWVQRPAAMAWFWAPVRRHPVAVPGCESLYFANTTIESDSGPVEICAHAGLLASHAILDAESASPGA